MKNIYEKQFNECLLNVLEILEKDDDRTFAEKKAEVIEYLTDRGEQSSDIVEEGLGVKIFTQFWERGEISSSMNGIVLRSVKDIDKEKFLELYRENTIMPSMFKDDLSKDFLWQEHIKNTALMCTIVIEDEYVGYCGIKNIDRDQWEIVIELMKAWTKKGIGYTAIGMLLDEVKARLGVTEFRVRIETDNYASQALFEKLGSIPNGISEFLLHGEEELQRCEEDNLHLIDDKMRAVAEKFHVEPRRLLSHVLEYKLVWK